MKLALLTAGLCLTASAQAASYECARARLPDERAVCADRSLNDRDVTMSVLYGLNRRMMAMGGRGTLIDGQAAWLTERRRCGTSRSCLTRVYDRRIGELRAFIDTRVVTQGPF